MQGLPRSVVLPASVCYADGGIWFGANDDRFELDVPARFVSVIPRGSDAAAVVRVRDSWERELSHYLIYTSILS